MTQLITKLNLEMECRAATPEGLAGLRDPAGAHGFGATRRLDSRP